MTQPEAVERLRADVSFRMLAQSLWRSGELRGAALLVGAGFSRNATRVSPVGPAAPLWSDLTRAMSTELGSSGDPDPRETANAYELRFGRQRLDALIRREVRDDEMLPGPLHARLLRLGWTDVLTTNYDTLLERASEALYERVYDVVRIPRDIARTRAPRIVKLHGSLSSQPPPVITRDDYDGYATTNAPFVNLARQILLESDLCMVGFSGRDPNFLAWSTWVVENISQHARTRFLVGVLDVDDEAALRADGLEPINLAPFAGTGRHQDARNATAMDVFLSALEASRPVSPLDWGLDTRWPRTEIVSPDDDGRWIGVHDAAFAAEFVRAAAPLWRAERTTYPNWLEAPAAVRSRVAAGLYRHLVALRNGLDAAGVPDRALTVSDVLFRVDLVQATLDPIDLTWIDAEIAARGDVAFDDADRVLIGRVMLRAARESGDGAAFERWSGWIVATDDEECRAEAAYAQALKARDELDWAAIEPLVRQLRGPDLVWRMRRAALLAEIGDGPGARREIAFAYRDLRRAATRSRDSIWIRSRLGWATLLRRFVGEFHPDDVDDGADASPPEDGWHLLFEDGGCNPWAVLELLDADLAEVELQRSKDRAVSDAAFDPGMVIGRGVSLRSAPSATIDLRAQRLADRVGLPGSIPGTYSNLMASRLAQAVELGTESDANGVSRCLVAVSRTSKPILESRFNRVAVALLEPEVATGAARKLARAIEHAVLMYRRTAGRGDMHWIEALAVWVEILSRLVVRLASSNAASAFDLAMRVADAEPFAHFSLFEPLGNLVQRSISSLGPEDVRHALGRLHGFPLNRGTARVPDGDAWPEPFSALDAGLLAEFGRPAADTSLEAMLWAFCNGTREDRGAVARRAEALARAGLLTAAQRDALGLRVWERWEAGALDLQARFAIPLLLQLPSADPALRDRMLRSALIDAGEVGLERSETTRWAGLVAGDLVRRVLGTNDLLVLFDAFIAWRPTLPPNDPLAAALAAPRVDLFGRSVASALNVAVLANLSVGSLSASALASLRSIFETLPAVPFLVLAPQAARLDPTSLDVVVAALLRGLSSNERTEVGWALLAVQEWISLGRRGGGPLPEEVRVAVLALAFARPARAMPNALVTVSTLIEDGALRGPEAARLTDSLCFAWRETGYADWSGSDAYAALMSLIRADVMRVCLALQAAGQGTQATARLIDEGLADPLPEVRRAAGRGGVPPSAADDGGTRLGLVPAGQGRDFA